MFDNGSDTGWAGFEDRNRNVGHSDGNGKEKEMGNGNDDGNDIGNFLTLSWGQ